MINRQIEVVKSASALREKLSAQKKDGNTVGLVPTMGALHDGHISLAVQSNQKCDFTVATIFVNPTQFAPGEDLDSYPRTLEADTKKLDTAGADLVFVPSTTEIYPPGHSTRVRPPNVAKRLEGEFRSTHFEGVCTVVLKLLNLVTPDYAFFGQKDFQQVQVIKRMVIDLNMPVEVVVCPIVRDEHGLALSSRNEYLDEKQREIALSLSRSLKFVKQQIETGRTDAQELMTEMRQMLIDGGVTNIDYAVIAEPETLEVVDIIGRPVVALIAAHVGSTRLIDNCLIAK